MLSTRECVSTNIKIGGIVPFSTTDYPDHLCCVLFFQGCPLRCSYCHNKHLLPVDVPSKISWKELQLFLSKRKALLDAVVLSGGEPLLQKGLVETAKAARDYGYKVGLHTSGIYPSRFKQILPLVDWVGFDVKAPFSNYSSITQAVGSGKKVRESLELLLSSGLPYEVRFTYDSALFCEPDVMYLVKELQKLGVQNLAVQLVRESPGQNNPCNYTENINLNKFEGFFEKFTVRA